MNAPVLQFLQQEKARLEKEIKLQQAEISNLQQYVAMLAELYHASHRLAAEENLLDTLDRLLYRVIGVVGAGDGSLSRLDRETDELVFLIVHGQIRQELPGYRIKSDVGVAGWVLSEGQPVIVNNPQQDWRFSLQVDEEFAFMTRSILGVPVTYREEPLGVIQLLNKREGGFTESDVTLVSVLAHIAGMALAAM